MATQQEQLTQHSSTWTGGDANTAYASGGITGLEMTVSP